MSSELMLEIRELVTSFRSGTELVNAIDKVSLQLFSGQTIGIVGESGSGKSVTSLSVMRLIADPPGKITSGSIELHLQGETVDLVTATERQLRAIRGKQISMIFQEPMTSLNPVLTCGEQVSEVLRQHESMSRSEAKKRTIELFGEVKLPDPGALYHKYPHEISGGQKQRVMIAMAMCCNPRVLIADEPTTALDVTVQKTILELMKDLQQRYNLGIIFISHDLGVISEIATQIVVMYRGRVVEQGTTYNVLNNPKHPYTRGLLACRPPMDYRVSQLPVVADFLEQSKQEPAVRVTSGAQWGERQSVQEREAGLRRIRSGPKILEVKNLSTWFALRKGLLGGAQEFFKAVDDVSFDLYEGETLGLVGESGCGKSTLGRTILKLIPARSGQVFFRGEEILGMEEREFRPLRKKMQLIFQDPYSSLNPRLTIGEAITEPMLVHGIGRSAKERKERAMRLLGKVGLDSSHFHRYPHEFSGGQRQRVCIARALALEPQFIVCDESVSALDVSVQAQVLNLLNSLKKEFGFSTIFISHDLGVVKFMSDRMIVMQKGRFEEAGDPDQIYRDPQSEYTRRLIASIPAVERTLEL